MPMVNILSGGAHAGRRVDIQDFMVMPLGAGSFAEAMEMTAEVYLAAGALMKAAGKLAGVREQAAGQVHTQHRVGRVPQPSQPAVQRGGRRAGAWLAAQAEQGIDGQVGVGWWAVDKTHARSARGLCRPQLGRPKPARSHD